ncbi:unnamed protein product [Cuscuta campestris]|uniref:Uncharacterized protein n=1 Tax=Cuscuta campestris TaxID=132261 RepID=A0A484L2G5_9ASTE|nr:unnamed protein product [Cuscuta campestris]
MADCHQRLEPGRHPDGFVPSHDVVQVHDLLGECICALGHPCIFDHPQEQPVYNPGHIRRWTESWRNAPAVGVRHGGGVSGVLQVETPAFHDWLCLASSGPIPEFQASEFQSCRFGRPLASPIQMDDQAPAAEESSVAVV